MPPRRPMIRQSLPVQDDVDAAAREPAALVEAVLWAAWRGNGRS